MFERQFTIKEIAMDLRITREYLHKCLKPFKYMFKAPGNTKNKFRKTKYNEEERKMIIKFYHLSKQISKPGK